MNFLSFKLYNKMYTDKKEGFSLVYFFTFNLGIILFNVFSIFLTFLSLHFILLLSLRYTFPPIDVINLLIVIHVKRSPVFY